MTVIRIADHIARRNEVSLTSSVSEFDQRFQMINEHAQSRITNWIPQVRAALVDIANKCSSDNWDSEGASPISIQTLGRALAFVQRLNLLNLSIPAPEIDAESDGEVAISWHNGPDRLLSISVGEHDILNFSGRLRDHVRCNGTELFALDTDEDDAVNSIVSRLKILFDLGIRARPRFPIRRNQQLGV